MWNVGSRQTGMLDPAGFAKATLMTNAVAHAFAFNEPRF